MNRRRSLIVAAGAIALWAAAARPLAARELAGVNMPDTLTAGDKAIKLNGLGLRKKAFFKVYVGGLYLETASKDAAAIVAADAPKAVRMTFLRDLRKSQLTEAFSEGFEANAKEKAAAQKAALDKMLALVPDVKEGETMSFVYVPAKGTTFYSGEKALGTFEGKDFADAIFLLWLGPKPPSEDLKKGMLG
jgi:hypothetical protein